MGRSRVSPGLASLGMAVLALLALGHARTAKATPAEKGTGRMNINPHTGRPIVSHGPAAGYLTREGVRELLEKHGFQNVDSWIAIVMRESQGDPEAMVDTQGMNDAELHAYWGPRFKGIKLGQELSVGLFQINVLANKKHSPEELKNPEVAMAYAFEMSNGGINFHPWGGKPA